MAWIKKRFKTLPLILVFIIGYAIDGCEGTDSRDKVDDTVKELSGQKNVERMEQMKKDIGDINKQQSERLEEPQ